MDIDGTICFYEKPQYEKNYNLAIPNKERIDKINKMYDSGKNIIVYWTARGTLTGINHFSLTYQQLNSWGCKFHELRMGKPYFDLFIDDRNINSEAFFDNTN